MRLATLTQENAGPIAVNPDRVIHCRALEEALVLLTFADGRTMKVEGTLEAVVAALAPEDPPPE